MTVLGLTLTLADLAPELGMLVLGAVLWVHPASRCAVKRAGCCARGLASDSRLPLWARCGLWIAVLPIPGPVDEVIGCAVIGGLMLRPGHRAVVAEVWTLS